MQWQQPGQLRDVPVPEPGPGEVLIKVGTVAAPFWGSIPELIEVIALARAGKVKMLVEHFTLERAGEAYDLLHHGGIQGRAVITPHG